MSKNKKLLESFVKYCGEHPDERFWQALRNWSDFNFIWESNEFMEVPNLRDTFQIKQ